MKHLVTIAAHACLILVLMLGTLLVVDRFNPSMDFVNNDVCKLFIALLCVCAVVLASAWLIRTYRINR